MIINIKGNLLKCARLIDLYQYSQVVNKLFFLRKEIPELKYLTDSDKTVELADKLCKLSNTNPDGACQIDINISDIEGHREIVSINCTIIDERFINPSQCFEIGINGNCNDNCEYYCCDGCEHSKL